MTFGPEFLDELRARVPLAGVVGRRVKLTRRGREHVGLCPFHNEKTPSFTVSEDKGFFHCFGCGAHGDVIGFVMRSEGLSFPEAVERMAGEAGLQVPQSSPSERAAARRRADLLDVLEAAAAWFEEQLRNPPGAAARDYLERRGVDREAAAAFRLGFAPDRRGVLRQALNARGVDDDRLVEAGLVKRPDNGGDLRDYFFNRLMFPITDRRGRVIAFGGRALGDSPAKYLNSPETPLFHKGRVLYNLARARQAALDTGELVVVEGYMDVIALAQAGFPAAVAPLGTALTSEQIAELWRLAEEPVLCLDGDEAGQRAGFRAAERALVQLRPGRSLRFAVLPRGDDPDSLVRSRGAGALRSLLDEARPLADLVWLMETEGRRFDTPERQAGLVRAMDEKVRRVPDTDVQKAYREALGRRFMAEFGYPIWGGPGPSRPAATQRFRRRDRRFGRPTRAPEARGTASMPGLGARQAPNLLVQRQEQVLLAALVNHPGLIVEHAEDLAEVQLTSAELTAFCRLLVDLSARNPDLDSDGLKCHLSDQGYSGILCAVLRPDVYVHGRFARPGTSPEEARDGVRHILEVQRGRQAASETEEAGRHLAEAMTEDALARLEAKQRQLRDSESRLMVLDHLEELDSQGQK